MAREGARKAFVCQGCGRQSPKWLGRCPDCGQWNTFLETTLARSRPSSRGAGAVELARMPPLSTPRVSTPYSEFDRVLGGGIVPGTLILVGGEPGIGKSTLLLQVAGALARRERPVLYASGEESAEQIRLRAQRLHLTGEGLFLLPETALEGILEQGQSLKPSLVVIDSIQAVALEGLGAPAGSLAQVRECTLRLLHWGKEAGPPIIIAGHVTKEGAIAGPHALEHMVDVVLYLEGEPMSSYRLLRSAKNRFGSTNEVGVFEMGEEGLVEVPEPSLAFLAERSAGGVGSAVVPTLEGSRPLLVEIQALTHPTSFALPRRTASGVDLNRLLLVAAVLSKRAGLPLVNQDLIVNVVGGLRVSEPAADLGMALALASCLRDRPLSPEMVALGEVGLGGEIRSVSQVERRLAEAARLGFKACLLPAAAARRISNPPLKLVAAATLAEALRQALAGPPPG